MQFGPKRAHVIFIFQNFIADFGLFLFMVLFFLVFRDIEVFLNSLVVVVIALIGPISRLIKYFYTIYTIDDEKLLVQSGWIKREKKELPLATISSVDMTQTLLFQIFNVYALQVENAGSIGGDSDSSVKLILGKEDAKLAKSILLSKKTGTVITEEGQVQSLTHEEPGQTLKVKISELITMCVFQIRWVVIAFQMIAYVSVMITYLGDMHLTGGKTATEYMVEVAKSLAPLVLIGVVIGVYFVSVIISAVATFIKYYDFRITNKKDSVKIQYGLITRKTHTLMKEKISGITFRQPVIMRAMKKGTLQIFVAGYGGLDDDTQEETVMLYPMVSEKDMYTFINWIMPEGITLPAYNKAPGRGLPYFFLCARFIFAVIVMVAAAFVPLTGSWKIAAVCTGVILLLIITGSVIMEYKTSAVASDKFTVTINYGSYRKNTVIIQRDKLEYVEDSASELKRRRKNLSTLTVGVLAPAGMSSHRVRNMDISVFNNVKEKLIY